jgi:hypothetical protein
MKRAGLRRSFRDIESNSPSGRRGKGLILILLGEAGRDLVLRRYLSRELGRRRPCGSSLLRLVSWRLSLRAWG